MKRYFFVIPFLFVIGLFFYFNNNDDLGFSVDVISIGISEDINYYSYINEYIGIDITNVDIDDSNVNYELPGQYQVVYFTPNNKYNMDILIIDDLPPIFNISDGYFALGSEIDVNMMVSDIVDHLDTKVTLEGLYNFNQLGSNRVIVKVSDSVGNFKSVYTNIHIVEDFNAPKLLDSDTLYLSVNEEYDFNDVLVYDDYDLNPKVSIDYMDLDISMEGTYFIRYDLEDASGNKSQYSQRVVVGDSMIDEKVIYLTFDDGPSIVTESILDTLDYYGVKATFFVTYGNSNYHYLISQAYSSGHAIGLHTYSHDYNEIYSAPYLYFQDLKKIDDLVFELTGARSNILRFPGGSSNTISSSYSKGIMSYLVSEVSKMGYTYFDWNLSSGDADASQVDEGIIVENSINSNAKYINLLMHDSATKMTTANSLGSIIEYYLDKGYDFKILDENAYEMHHKVNN